MEKTKKDLKVKVAMRVRPLSCKELEKGNSKCVKVHKNTKQVVPSYPKSYILNIDRNGK